MNKYSFDIKTSDDFYNKLKEDYNEFCTKETSSRIALNCAMTAWHLHEWIYKDYKHTQLKAVKNIGDFKDKIKILCPSLKIMQDLCNGTKHTEGNTSSKVINTEKYEGSFDFTFDSTFDTSSLDIELSNGTKTEFSVELQKCIDFYESYFSNFLKKI
ncbi:hypothetical protein [Epilithonimonas hispanica]|uniref:Uncharacterized protein n=1 Tax=Epilithonimonas hispanica TaxID=358687 RepID=A0A3D9CYL9_9FLAO|nr:hypothetical protein [Epilithonimonas hispanica]REC70859.1 hypothetical protein DRF58_07730 [Epilithonimonas hispanica]